MKGNHVLLGKVNKYVSITIFYLINECTIRCKGQSDLGISNALELKLQMNYRLNLEEVETWNIRIISKQK